MEASPSLLVSLLDEIIMLERVSNDTGKYVEHMPDTAECVEYPVEGSARAS
jgi:hypothetical protein